MRHGCHAFAHQVGDAHEGQSTIDEALHGDLVGRVEGAAGRATTFDRLEREAGGRESIMIDGLELERAQLRPIDPACRPIHAVRMGERDLDRQAHVGRADLGDEAKVAAAVRTLAAKVPTYVTLKDVKKRWGHGQEDVLPVAQFEKLWGDMTALPEVSCRFVVVSRQRGQQLKDVAQLDGWLRDGSAAYVERLCDWGSPTQRASR